MFDIVEGGANSYKKIGTRGVHSTYPNQNFSELNEEIIYTVVFPYFGQRYQILKDRTFSHLSVQS